MRLLTAALLFVIASPSFADTPASVRYLERDGKTRVTTTGSATAQTQFTLASVGKTMTSVAFLRMVDFEGMSLDDPASDWLSADITNGLGGLDGVTLRHLLTMTSGLPDYLTDDYIRAALADPDNVQRANTAISYAFFEDMLFRPGQDFDYSNTNYVLLGLIMEGAAGNTYSDLMRQLVFDPLDMDDTFAFGSRDLPDRFPNGHEDREHIRSYYQSDGFGDGGIISNAPDLARFYRALLIERRLLSTQLMRELEHDPLGVGYGMGIEMDDGIYGHSGGDLGFSTDVRMDLSSGDLAIVLIAQSDADTDWTLDALGN